MKCFIKEGRMRMDYNIGDLAQLNKVHTCGSNIWEVVTCSGRNLKLRCNKCHKNIFMDKAYFQDNLVTICKEEREKSFDSNTKNDIIQVINTEDKRTKKNWIKYVENPTFDQMKKAVSENSSLIRFIKNPPEDIAMLAINKNPFCLQFIDNPSSELIKFALSKNVGVIQLIDYPSDELAEYASQIYPKEIGKYVKTLSGKYVKKKGLQETLDNNDTLSQKQILTLLKTNGNLIKDITNPTHDMIMTAVRNNPKAIQYVKQPSFDIVKYIAERSPGELQKYKISEKENLLQFYIKNISEKEKKQFILSNLSNLRYFDTISYEIQLAAIKKDYDSLRWIKDIHPLIYETLFNDSTFDISTSIGDFPLQLRIAEQFERIKKNRAKEERKADLDVVNNESTNESLRNYQDIQNSTDTHDVINEMINEIQIKDFAVRLINNELSISEYLNAFAVEIKCKSVEIASGYVYRSGLNMINPLFDTIKMNGGEIRLIIGSLKNYFQISQDTKIMSFNKDTAILLNELKNIYDMDLYTYEEKFFHGKYYLEIGEKYSCCIIGSSNLTSSGFTGNYELNTLFVMKNESEQFQVFKQWFTKFLGNCTKIDMLAIEKFIDSNMHMDAISQNSTLIAVNTSKIKYRIENLTDEELKFRLNLWMSKKPTNVYENLDIDNLKDYIGLEYKDYRLIVFESFIAANGYFYFYGDNIYEVVDGIKELTKTQIFKKSSMNKRGYHIKNREILKSNIDGLFCKNNTII